MNAEEVFTELQKIANPKKAEILSRFFKTGTGEYSEGDKFLGIMVPESRNIVRKYKNLPIREIQKLLQSEFHEARLIALLLLVDQFEKDKKRHQEIFTLYLQSTRCINNWDLVDLSSPHIVGGFLLGQSDRGILKKLAKSDNLWEKRIAILATLRFIVEKKEYADTFRIAEILLHDDHDLIHKAVGWMLREVGKRISEEVEEEFLKKYYTVMPRTMLRYAIERFNKDKRKKYLLGLV